MLCPLASLPGECCACFVRRNLLHIPTWAYLLFSDINRCVPYLREALKNMEVKQKKLMWNHKQYLTCLHALIIPILAEGRGLLHSVLFLCLISALQYVRTIKDVSINFMFLFLIRILLNTYMLIMLFLIVKCRIIQICLTRAGKRGVNRFCVLPNHPLFHRPKSQNLWWDQTIDPEQSFF